MPGPLPGPKEEESQWVWPETVQFDEQNGNSFSQLAYIPFPLETAVSFQTPFTKINAWVVRDVPPTKSEHMTQAWSNREFGPSVYSYWFKDGHLMQPEPVRLCPRI